MIEYNNTACSITPESPAHMRTLSVQITRFTKQEGNYVWKSAYVNDLQMDVPTIRYNNNKIDAFRMFPDEYRRLTGPTTYSHNNAVFNIRYDGNHIRSINNVNTNVHGTFELSLTDDGSMITFMCIVPSKKSNDTTVNQICYIRTLHDGKLERSYLALR